MKIRFLVLALLLLLVPPGHMPASGQLAPTRHAAVPGELQDLWLVPAGVEKSGRTPSMYAPLVEAAEAFGAGDFARAASLASTPKLSSTALAGYAAYYNGLAQLKLARAAEARRIFAQLRKADPPGQLAAAAAIAEAEAAEALGDYRAAVSIYETLAAEKATFSEDVLARLGRAALAAGDRKKAATAFLRVYYEHPLSDAAASVSTELQGLEDVIVRRGVAPDLGRAALLFGARRYRDARAAYEAVRAEVGGEDRDLVELRLAECDYHLGRHAAAVDGLTPWLHRGPRQAEARFFHLSALRELGRHDEYIAHTAALVTAFPDSSWAEEALNNLGTHYILTNRDDQAAATFKDLFDRFPNGSRGERAAWKAGWWAYKNGNHAEAVRIFERAAAAYPRSDYRPSFLYWSARAHRKLGDADVAQARYRLVLADYGSSYYGQLAVDHLPRNARTAAAGDVVAASNAVAEPPPRPPTAALVQALLAAGLYDDAINELRYAQRAWGTSPPIEATLAWAYNRKGELRRGITLMRRAYPQHLTAGGRQLPTEILEIIFPLTYWNLIRKHATARELDPYLIAALVAQESTFDPKIRSAANAWGLMQVVPGTGRRLARSLGIRSFRTAMLTDPEINVRMGTLYFSRLVQQFGGEHYALASYNAGENRVVRWKAERPGVDQDEFIDDIPFPETQNYVKRILGTAEDYRALYGSGGGRPLPVPGSSSRAAR